MYWALHTLLLFPYLLFIAVLATIDSGNFQDVTITEEESANFTCKFSKGDSDSITVYWTVDGEKRNCHAGEDVGSETIACYNTETQSVLLIRNTSAGRHQVECILQQNIPEMFRNDRSFNDMFNNITRRGFLTIRPIGEFVIC